MKLLPEEARLAAMSALKHRDAINLIRKKLDNYKAHLEEVEKQAGDDSRRIIQVKKALFNENNGNNFQKYLDEASNEEDGSDAQRIKLEALSVFCEKTAKESFSERRDPLLGKHTRKLLIGIAGILATLTLGLGLLAAMGLSKCVVGRYAFWRTTGEGVLNEVNDTLSEIKKVVHG